MNYGRHSPPFQGGVAARLQEMAPFLDWRSRGGSYPTQTTPAAPRGRGHPSLERRGMRPRFERRQKPHADAAGPGVAHRRLRCKELEIDCEVNGPPPSRSIVETTGSMEQIARVGILH